MGDMIIGDQGIYRNVVFRIVTENGVRCLSIQGTTLGWYIRQGSDSRWLTDVTPGKELDAMKKFMDKLPYTDQSA